MENPSIIVSSLLQVPTLSKPAASFAIFQNVFIGTSLSSLLFSASGPTRHRDVIPLNQVANLFMTKSETTLLMMAHTHKYIKATMFGTPSGVWNYGNVRGILSVRSGIAVRLHHISPRLHHISHLCSPVTEKNLLSISFTNVIQPRKSAMAMVFQLILCLFIITSFSRTG